MKSRLPVPALLLDFINEGDKFIIAGHEEPDGDCAGSQLALAKFLSRLGKTAVPCSPGPFKRTELFPLKESFLPCPPESVRKEYRVLLLDCTSLERAGNMAAELGGLSLAVVDHHATAGVTYPADYRDHNSSSVTAMILRVIEAMGQKPTREEAELLFFGLCTDTGFFRHATAYDGEVFRTAARLVDAGASPQRAFLAINGGKSLGSRILAGRILARTQSYFDGRFLLSTEGYEEKQRFGSEGRDSDLIYQALASVAGVEAYAVVKQENPEECTAALRSRDRINVARIAEKFGGGGHKNAAGLKTRGSLDEISALLIAEFEKALRETPA